MPIERKKILDSDSKESLSDRRIFGGKPDGMINFSKPKYICIRPMESNGS